MAPDSVSPASASLAMRQTLNPDILLIDGLGRAGKQLVAKLASNFDRVEGFQYSAGLEQFPILTFLGHLEPAPAIAFLRLMVDELVYDRMVGRNLNMRASDASSVLKANDFTEYLRRSIDPEGDQAIDRFNAQKRIPCFLTHHMLVHFDLFASAYPSAKLVHAVRHPVDLVHSWHSRGWGARIGTDPRAFALALAFDSGPVPWWSADLGDTYVAMTPIDRVISDVLRLQSLCETAFDRLAPDRRRQIHHLCYENLFTDAAVEMRAVAQFIGAPVPADFDSVLARERVPRPEAVSLEGRRDKLEDIKKSADDAALEKLAAAAGSYETEWDLTPVRA